MPLASRHERLQKNLSKTALTQDSSLTKNPMRGGDRIMQSRPLRSLSLRSRRSAAITPRSEAVLSALDTTWRCGASFHQPPVSCSSWAPVAVVPGSPLQLTAQLVLILKEKPLLDRAVTRRAGHSLSALVGTGVFKRRACEVGGKQAIPGLPWASRVTALSPPEPSRRGRRFLRRGG